MRQRLLARHRAVLAAEHAGLRAARSGEGFESQAREHARRARIPRIGDDEGFRALMQRAEARGFFGLVHDSNPSANARAPGSACTRRILRFAVKPPNTPATITQERKNTLIAGPPAAAKRPQTRP